MKPMWLFAETLNLGDMTCLLVYKSPALRPDDPMFADVKAIQDRASASEEIFRGTVQDSTMMFGHGEWICTLLQDTPELHEPEHPGVRTFVNVCKEWGDFPCQPEELAQALKMRLELEEANV
ncbi:hypothetical protein SEA_EAGLEPRIDE_71 [Mycobacterium phage Eaglepride]|nr:hypothetical protein SEA_EAGLEPRIDE_71 [Mycobacterium phage Eaglepride]